MIWRILRLVILFLLEVIAFQALAQSNQVADQDEFNALKALWDNTNGASWTTKTNWPTTGNWPSTATAAQMATWYGVTVTNGDITSLVLTSNHLVGTLPAGLSNLSKVVVLKLDHNSITGSVPSSYGSFSLATDFYISYNSLSGAMPDLSGLTSIKRLSLGSNGFTAGAIPAWLAGLSSLESFYMSTCNRNGTIPDLTALTHLTGVALGGNALTGSFPISLAQIPTLQGLDVSGNQLSGSMPEEIGNLSALTSLSINDNHFSGAIPDSFNELTNLQQVNGYDNSFTALPSDLSNLTHITQFLFNNNKITGSLPTLHAGLTTITKIDLRVNQLSGSIPASYGNLPNLTILYLASNNLTGAIPSQLSTLTKLNYLDLHGNQLSGPIPSIFTNMTQLAYLDLSYNLLNGPVPSLRGSNIIINDNALSGTFPSITNSPVVVSVNASNNGFTSIPSSIWSLTNTPTLVFNNNELTSIAAKSTADSTVLQVKNNRLDFSTLNQLRPKLKHSSVFVTQKTINGQAATVLTEGSQLVITARPTDSNITIAWQKQDASGSWTTLSNDQDAVMQTYTRNPASASDKGVYRWTSTSSLFSSTSIQSDEIEANTSTGFALDNWCFQYKYDERRRMIQKKVPGADWMYMVYDERDRLVMTQDGEQRKKNQWAYTKYDALNRPVITGLYTHTALLDQVAMTTVLSASPFYETFDGVSASSFQYTSNVMPSSSFGGTFDPLTVMYYDNYDFINSDIYFKYQSAEIDGQFNHGSTAAFTRVVGQVTGTWVRMLGNDKQWLRTVNYYDDRQRLVQTVSDNHKRGEDITTSVYDFTGKVIATRTRSTDHRLQWSSVPSTMKASEDRVTCTTGTGAPTIFSVQQIAASADGWVEFTCSSNVAANSSRTFGLSVGTPGSVSYGVKETITVSPLPVVHTIQFSESTVLGTVQNVGGGDVIRIERKNGSIYYSRNGIVFHQASAGTTSALKAHLIMNLVNTELYNPKISVEGTGRSTERHLYYDHAGRLTDTWYRVDDGDSILLSRNGYNEVGQLINKKLHSTDQVRFHQGLDYRYNVRGWLTSINGAQLTPNSIKNPADANVRGDLFGIDLYYNELNTGLANTALFNGNISAMSWSDNLGIGTTKQRGYNFSYDPMNRLNSALQKSYTTVWTGGSAFQESGVTYDLNGNIKTLLRTDGSGTTMDSLHYHYGYNDGTSNTLRSVHDSGTPAGFTDVDNGDDYSYDDNGNMASDKNKWITSIAYNHLNLPEKVTKSTGDYIHYTYDATGKKLIQDVYDATNVLKKRSDYRGEWFYENDTLKFVNNEEGRVILTGTTPEYQYHLKDHLGNVRMTFTTKREVDEAVANFETETADFLYYEDAVKINSEIFDHTDTGPTYYSARLNGTDKERFGVARSLSVMAGDTINMEVFAKYLDPDTTITTPVLAAFLASIANGTAPAGALKDGLAPGSTGGVLSPFWTMFAPTSENNNQAPKAYLNWIVFDRSYNLTGGGARQVTTAAAEHGQDGTHETLSRQLVIQEAGYVYVYLSNDNYAINGKVVDVFFDDLKVEHVKGPVVESQSYYPFGLTFNSYNRENSVANQYQYNGKEKQEELGLDWLDYGQRMYQPELGRFFSPDRFASKYFNTSPYSYGANNPALYVDINGDSVWTTHTSNTDSDGNTTVTHTINITGKVLKQSNGTATARGVAAGLNGRLNAQRSSTTKKNDDGTTTTEVTKMNAQYTAASSMDDVSSSDHLVVITDGVLGDADPDLGGGSASGIGAIGGQISYVEDGGAVETAFHEVGHNLGLDHPNANSGDPMSYTGRGGNFSPAQMDQILNNSIYGVPNRGSNSTTMGASFSNTPQGKFYGTTDNTRPFSVAPGTRAKVPLPLTSGYR